MLKLRKSFTATLFICIGFAALFSTVSAQAGAKKTRRFIVYKKQTQALKFSTSNDSGTQSSQKSVLALENEETWRQELLNHQMDPDVEFIEEDVIMERFSNDTYFNDQWALDQLAASSLWTEFDQSSNIVVAVVDTGIVNNHPDLSHAILSGADFISDVGMANDGDGRDLNANDSGDWVSSSDSCYRGIFEPSSWHGTHVAGIIAAKKNNSQGVAGLFDNVKILPVRVLGKCGGFTSDIADAVRWAAGLPVSGMPINNNPAKVINLSLGAAGPCGRTMQEAVDAATIAGSVVVVAAGNDGRSLDTQSYSPANCAGVITVGATAANRDIPSYSNYSRSNNVDIYAPGGDDWYGGVISTYNNGDTGQGSSTYQELNGTSMATPYVAATVAFMMAVNPNLYPLQYADIIRQTASQRNSFNRNLSYQFLQPHAAVESAQTASPDDRFRYIPSEPIVSGGVGLFKPTSEDGGVGCGTVAIIGSDGGDGPGGPGQKASFLVGLILAAIMGMRPQRKSKKS